MQLLILETNTTSARKRKRGGKNLYSPDQQYKTAKYAVENGVSKAAKHFSKHLGKNIKKVAFVQLKKAYLLKKATKDDFSKGLECDKRGKPVMLGENCLGKDVVDYIKKLRLSCGIVNRSITIAAARGIISVKNRQVLAEYGGPIERTNCWAQSFLRRLNFVQRKGTKAARKLPENFSELKKHF